MNTKGSDTLVGRLRKAGMYLAFIYLFIFLLLLLLLLLECLWSAKMLRIEGQLAFTKPHLFGQFIFHRETRAGSDHDFTTEYNRPKIP